MPPWPMYCELGKNVKFLESSNRITLGDNRDGTGVPGHPCLVYFTH